MKGKWKIIALVCVGLCCALAALFSRYTVQDAPSIFMTDLGVVENSIAETDNVIEAEVVLGLTESDRAPLEDIEGGALGKYMRLGVFNDIDKDGQQPMTNEDFALAMSELIDIYRLPTLTLCPGDQTDFSGLPKEYVHREAIVKTCSNGWFSTSFIDKLQEPVSTRTVSTYIAKLAEYVPEDIIEEVESYSSVKYKDAEKFFESLGDVDRSAEVPGIVKKMLWKSQRLGFISIYADNSDMLQLERDVYIEEFCEMVNKVIIKFGELNLQYDLR